MFDETKPHRKINKYIPRYRKFARPLIVKVDALWKILRYFCSNFIEYRQLKHYVHFPSIPLDTIVFSEWYQGTRPQHILLLVLVKHLVQNEIQPNQKCFVKCTNNRAASIHWISVGFWTTITKFGELNACIWFRMAILGTSSIYKCNVFSFLVRSIIDLTYSMSETFKNFMML